MSGKANVRTFLCSATVISGSETKNGQTEFHIWLLFVVNGTMLIKNRGLSYNVYVIKKRLYLRSSCLLISLIDWFIARNFFPPTI